MMLNIHWPQVFVVTIVLYVLIIITLPFNEIRATLYLFALIAYWSRIPAVGIDSPGSVTYALDIVDVLAFLISINVGGAEGAAFQAAVNFVSRFAGVVPRWETVVKDALTQSVSCLLIPFILPMLGNDLVKGMIWYTSIRWVLFIPLRFVEPTPRPWPVFIYKFISIQTSTVLVNAFYTKYFGWFFDSLLKNGMHFHWGLFLFTTLVIFLAKTFFFGSSGLKMLNYRYWLKVILGKMTKYEKKEVKRTEEIKDEEIIKMARRII
jgi:hypothetical protein